MDLLIQNLRQALRSLARNPTFTVVVLAVLALGIGLNSAIFTVVNGVLLRPLPYGNPDRLMMIWGFQEGKGKDTVVPADYLDWRRSNRSFSAIAGYGLLSFNLAGGDHPERADGLSVSANFFATLGVKPALGRTFLDAASGAADERDVAVLGDGLWRRAFGGDRSIVGRSILLNGRGYTVVGVMGRSFKFHEPSELWVRAPRDVPELPIDIGVDPATMRGLSYMRAIGRLRAGVSPAQARADMDGIAREQGRQFPDTNGRRGILLVPMQKEVVGDVEKELIALLAAVGLVLLIACTNAANLFFIRSVDRQREINLRVALGASRSRLVRQLLTESTLLGLAAGALGLGLAYLGTRLLVGLSPGDIPRLEEIRVDGAVLAFTFLVAVFTGVLCGLLPVLQLRRFDVVGALKESGSKATESGWRRRLRAALAIGEMALAVALLLGAGLMLKSFAKLREVKPGFVSAHLLTFQVPLPLAKYSGQPAQAAFYGQLLDRVRTLPGVRSAAVVLNPPVGGESISLEFAIEGHPRAASEVARRDGFQAISAGYFEAMGIPLIRGRAFAESDSRASQRVAILSQEMARRYWGDRDPVGSVITFGDPKNAKSAKRFTVVGVAANVLHDGPGGVPRAETYVPYTQWSWPDMTVVLRGAGDPLPLVAAIRRQVQDLDAAQPITAVHTMDDLLSSSLARPRFMSFLLGVFAGVALLLAAIGLYGVMAYNVSQRTPEIGIKMALGARRGDVVGEILRHGAILAALGIAAGIGVAQPLARLLKTLLFGVPVWDAGTYAVVLPVLFAVALLATVLPARRASRIDPVQAMRGE
jgi:putative ABC transport system permease protein